MRTDHSNFPVGRRGRLPLPGCWCAIAWAHEHLADAAIVGGQVGRTPAWVTAAALYANVNGERRVAGLVGYGINRTARTSLRCTRVSAYVRWISDNAMDNGSSTSAQIASSRSRPKMACSIPQDELPLGAVPSARRRLQRRQTGGSDLVSASTRSGYCCRAIGAHELTRNQGGDAGGHARPVTHRRTSTAMGVATCAGARLAAGRRSGRFGAATAGLPDQARPIGELVQMGLSGAAMFDPKGTVLQPAEVLRKKNVLVERGSFQPGLSRERRHDALGAASVRARSR